MTMLLADFLKNLGIEEKDLATNMLKVIKQAIQINYTEQDINFLQEIVQEYFSPEQQKELVNIFIANQKWQGINCIFNVVNSELKNEIIKKVNLEAVIERTYGNKLFVKIASYDEKSAIKLLNSNISILSEKANVKSKLSLISSTYDFLPTAIKNESEKILSIMQKEDSTLLDKAFQKAQDNPQIQKNLRTIAEKLSIKIPLGKFSQDILHTSQISERKL